MAQTKKSRAKRATTPGAPAPSAPKAGQIPLALTGGRRHAKGLRGVGMLWTRQHALWLLGNQWRCESCGLQYEDLLAVMARPPCTRPVAVGKLTRVRLREDGTCTADALEERVVGVPGGVSAIWDDLGEPAGAGAQYADAISVPQTPAGATWVETPSKPKPAPQSAPGPSATIDPPNSGPKPNQE